MNTLYHRAKAFIARRPMTSLGVAGLALLGLASLGIMGVITDTAPPASVDLPSTVPPPSMEASPAERPPAPSSAAMGTELDRALARLERGSLAFTSPERMVVTEQFRVRLLLSPGSDVEALRRALAAEESRIETGRDVRISNVMQARLSGPGFRIDPPDTVETAISRAEPTEWRWWITATTPGRQPLTLALYAKVVVDGRERARLIKTFDRTIEIAVAPRSWLVRLNDAVEPWQKLLGATIAFVSAAAGLYAWWRKRNAKPPLDDS